VPAIDLTDEEHAALVAYVLDRLREEKSSCAAPKPREIGIGDAQCRASDEANSRTATTARGTYGEQPRRPARAPITGQSAIHMEVSGHGGQSNSTVYALERAAVGRPCRPLRSGSGLLPVPLTSAVSAAGANNVLEWPQTNQARRSLLLLPTPKPRAEKGSTDRDGARYPGSKQGCWRWTNAAGAAR
jgi:hypothetical protein